MIRKENSGKIKGRSHSNRDGDNSSLVMSLNWIDKHTSDLILFHHEGIMMIVFHVTCI